MSPWQLVPGDGPIQDVLAAAGVQAGRGTGAGARSGGADPGEEGARWDCCPAVREAAHAMNQVSQVMQAPDLQPQVLQALKRRLSVRLPAQILCICYMQTHVVPSFAFVPALCDQ